MLFGSLTERGATDENSVLYKYKIWYNILMRNYFRDISKPRWYVVVLFAFAFIVQCMAVINLCAQFGGGYYVIIPIQVVIGYLNVFLYLVVQKDIRQRKFAYIAAIGLVLGLAASFLLFEGVYTSVPRLKGVMYGVMMQVSLAEAFCAIAVMIGHVAIELKKTDEKDQFSEGE